MTGSLNTALLTADNIDTVDTVDMVYTVDMVCTVDTVAAIYIVIWLEHHRNLEKAIWRYGASGQKVGWKEWSGLGLLRLLEHLYGAKDAF